MNSIRLAVGSGMAEEVSGARFATLENEVKHITSDVTDIKQSTKTTELAIQSIDKSIAIMTEHVQQNKLMGPRIETLEKKVAKVEIKMAAYAGGIAALSFIIFKFDKVIAFFG
jgi:septation ring formation regulator EzrA